LLLLAATPTLAARAECHGKQAIRLVHKLALLRQLAAKYHVESGHLLTASEA